MDSSYDHYIGIILDHRYHLLSPLGTGGMSVVFEADDLVMNRKVAVKILKDEIANDETEVARFITESQAVSMLSHPNIVKIFDISVKGKIKYIVMERVNGITLKMYMRRKGALSTEETISYAEQVLKALAHAHAKGIVHQDIKPQNILLLKNGQIKVTDFGIAKLEGVEEKEAQKSDKIVGTVYYISPERASGDKPVDHRTDLYSTGVLLYEMATGELPFDADTAVSIALKQMNEIPKPPSAVKPDIPKGLEQIILGAMEKKPERRFQSAEQMLRYLEKIRTNPDFVFKTQQKLSEGGGNTTSIANDMKQKKRRTQNRSRKESHSFLPIILGVAVAFGIVVVTAGLTILDRFMKNQTMNASLAVTVPTAVGEIYDEQTIGQLFDPSLYSLLIEYSYDANTPANTILEQDPLPDSSRKIPKNRKLTVALKVSQGTKFVTVPDYTITDYRRAQIDAEKKGFYCEPIGIADDSIEIGYIIKTDPPCRTEAAYGSKLTLYYSTGSTVDMKKVPSLTGLTPKAAYAKIKGSFTVGDVTYDNSDTVPEGMIISQSLPADTQAVKGSAINFVLSLGPVAPPEPPPVIEPVTEAPTEQTPASPNN